MYQSNLQWLNHCRFDWYIMKECTNHHIYSNSVLHDSTEAPSEAQAEENSIGALPCETCALQIDYETPREMQPRKRKHWIPQLPGEKRTCTAAIYPTSVCRSECKVARARKISSSLANHRTQSIQWTNQNCRKQSLPNKQSPLAVLWPWKGESLPLSHELLATRGVQGTELQDS